MKSFNQFMNEADIRKNPAISPEYLASLDKRAEASAREIEQKYGQDMVTLMRSVREVQMMQRGKENQIEELTRSVLIEQYGEILGETELDVKIPTGPNEIKKIMQQDQEDQDDLPTFKEVEDDSTKAAINKRKILNTIAQGEAINSKLMLMSDTNFDGLSQIFGEANARKMIDLLVKITEICNARDWRIPEEVGAAMIEQGDSLAGVSKIEWKPKETSGESTEDQAEPTDQEGQEDQSEVNEIPVIIIRGLDQAMLFHEAVKGIYGLINQGGLAHLDDETIAKVFMNTDTAQDEVQDLKRAKLTAADLRDFIQSFPEIDSMSNGREYVWGKMIDATVLPDQDFLELMKLIFDSAPLYRTQSENEPAYTETEIQLANESMPRAKSIVQNLIKLIQQELEEWQDSQDEPEFSIDVPTRDESELSKSEIQKMIDAALDARDFEEVRRLSKYMEE